jgi:hypothetical protein
MIPAPQPRAKPTLEDLLRAKRSEKPDAAFWQDFERGLRQKQLAAIIEPRPWWLGLSLLSRKIGPLGMPISAGAAALLALVVMRVSPVGGLTQAVSLSSPEPVAVAIVTPSASAAKVLSTASSVAAPAATVGAIPLTQAVTQEPKVASAERAKPDQLAFRNPLPAPAADAVVPASARAVIPLGAEGSGIAFANKAPASSAVALNSANDLDFEVLVSASSAIGRGITEVTNSSFALTGDDSQSDRAGLNPRQARLLSNAMGGAEDKSLASVRERVLHRLADDEARYAAISRVGVNADRLSLKF